MKRAVFFFEKSLHLATPKLWPLQSGFLQSDRLPSEEERQEWKAYWISASQGPAQASISKSLLFLSMGQCHFSKMQLGRKVKRHQAAFCRLLSTSNALSYLPPHPANCLLCWDDKKCSVKFWGPKESRTHNLTVTFAEPWSAEQFPPKCPHPNSCYLNGQGNFADVLKVKDLGMGKLSKIIQVSQSKSDQSQKKEMWHGTRYWNAELWRWRKRPQSKWMQVAPRSWLRQGNWYSPKASGRNTAPPITDVRLPIFRTLRMWFF